DLLAERGRLQQPADRPFEYAIEVALRIPELPVGIRDARLEGEVQAGGAGGVESANRVTVRVVPLVAARVHEQLLTGARRLEPSPRYDRPQELHWRPPLGDVERRHREVDDEPFRGEPGR